MQRHPNFDIDTGVGGLSFVANATKPNYADKDVQFRLMLGINIRRNIYFRFIII